MSHTLSKRRFRFTPWILAAVVMILVGFVSWQLFLSNVGARFCPGLIADFDMMPADDSELNAWLRVQPGVAPESIRIFREGQSLTVCFGIDRNLRGEPELPSLAKKCKELGYRGETGEFRDRPLPFNFPVTPVEQEMIDRANEALEAWRIEATTSLPTNP